MTAESQIRGEAASGGKSSVLVSIRNCEIALRCDPNTALREAVFSLPRKGASAMDVAARRKQLSAALNRVAGGDRAALRLVYDMTAAKLFAVWRKAGAFDADRASPITWLVAIARNRAIDRLRASGASRRSEPIEAAEGVADPLPLASDVLEAEQESGRLGGCLDELETRQSAAIRSAFMDGLTYEELAKRMGVPLGTMKSWIRRGLAKLKECLER
jgi:RNA polymerase sigma-70 factor (ECF subfamily)